MIHPRSFQVWVGLGILGCLMTGEAQAQDLSLLDPAQTQLISQEISGDAAYGAHPVHDPIPSPAWRVGWALERC